MKKEAFDFVKIVRAAEVGILKPHKSIRPEVIEPRHEPGIREQLTDLFNGLGHVATSAATSDA